MGATPVLPGGDPDQGCFRGVSVVSPIVKGFDSQWDAYRGEIPTRVASAASP
jgi:hypothetical protein